MRYSTAALSLAFAFAAFSQQIPFVSITGPNAPKGASFLLEDAIRGGLWLGGVTEGAEGLVYFDGSKFVSPIRGPFPKVEITGMAEDSAGGIWLATRGGLYRVFQGHLERIAEGGAHDGIVQAAPDVFLTTVTKPGSRNAGLLRIAKANGQWKVETIVPSTPQIRFQVDHAGNILYPCPGGYCEFRGVDVERWHAGASLGVTRHQARRSADASDIDGVYRDRLGCVWLRSLSQIVYQCPGDAQAVALPESIAGHGQTIVSELEDGSIVIPGFAKLAIGRPGHFRVVSALNGNPGTINAVARRDGCIWLGIANGNGLSVFPTHLGMEFWTQREGLDGNTWSIIRTSRKTFAVAGETLRVLDRDRSRWSSLPVGQAVERLSAGPKGTVLVESLTHWMLRLSEEGKVIGRVHLADVAMEDQDVQTDSHGDLWACSQNGLLHKTVVWHPILTDEDPSKNPCLAFTINRQGDIWYGDFGQKGGLTLVEDPAGTRPRIQHFAGGGEVGAATVRFLGMDNRGWIWRGSPIGVYVADPDQARQGRWLYLNGLDGIAGIDANHRSFFNDPDGSVWFGVGFSINHLYPPADFLYPRYSPDVFISGYSLNGGEMQMADMVTNVKSGSSLVAHIGSLQFDRRNALCLRYRLLPEQPTWRETKNLDLPFGALPSGARTLEVQGRIFTGPWSGTVARSFSVLPPAWSSGPFLVAYAIAGIGLLTSVQLLRRKRQRDEQTLLPDLGEWRLGALLSEGHELSGTILDGRYEVGELLARGGFANVMAGYDRSARRRCAIKIFRGEVKNKESILRGFEQEVAALRQIRHPNVVSIYADGLTSSGAPYLVMEFVVGKNLRQILEDGPLPPQRVGRLVAQIADALDAIHARGICHRDVKPENVIVRNNGDTGEEAVLIDFSIAIIKDANETLHGLSRAAAILKRHTILCLWI